MWSSRPELLSVKWSLMLSEPIESVLLLNAVCHQLQQLADKTWSVDSISSMPLIESHIRSLCMSICSFKGRGIEWKFILIFVPINTYIIWKLLFIFILFWIQWFWNYDLIQSLKKNGIYIKLSIKGERLSPQLRRFVHILWSVSDHCYYMYVFCDVFQTTWEVGLALLSASLWLVCWPCLYRTWLQNLVAQSDSKIQSQLSL